jgi:hypothetical protein
VLFGNLLMIPVEQSLLHPEDKTAQRPLSLPEDFIEDRS